MFKELKNSLLYSGLDKETYSIVRDDVMEANHVMISVFSCFATILIFAVWIFTYILDSTVQNRGIYFAGFIGSLLLLFASVVLAKRFKWLILPLVYVAFSIFFLYGIYIGTISNPTQQTVTFMVMLVFLPMLFVDRTIHVMIGIILYTALFIFMCFRSKSGDVLSIDVQDAIIYSTLGIVSGAVINRIKMRKYLLEYRLSEASRIDLLTQMNNRNSFETDLANYSDKCKEKLFCVYIDANGLHELNNAKGHEKGDDMLKFIANTVKDAFGKEYSYRIGGDEFVAFVSDMEESKIVSIIKNMNDIIEKEGYNIAVGCGCQSKSDLNMSELIKKAESIMYQNKSLYYKECNHDRRNRQS